MKLLIGKYKAVPVALVVFLGSLGLIVPASAAAYNGVSGTIDCTYWQNSQNIKEGSVTVQNRVITAASFDCDSKVIIPDTVTGIVSGAFSRATELETISVNVNHPRFTSIMRDLAFASRVDCIQVTSGGSGGKPATPNISISGVNANYTVMDGALINNTEKSLIYFQPPSSKPMPSGAYPSQRGVTYSIPAGITSIGDGAFRGSCWLNSVTIPASVTSIGSRAFQGFGNSTLFGPDPAADLWTTLEFLGNAPTLIANDAFYGGGNRALVKPQATGFGKKGDMWKGLTVWIDPLRAEASAQPAISGKAISTANGTNKLTANKGTWTGYPTPAISYQWYACTAQIKVATQSIPKTCKTVSKATKSTLAVTTSYKGKFITVAVTGKSTGTTPTVWLSKSTAKVS